MWLVATILDNSTAHWHIFKKLLTFKKVKVVMQIKSLRNPRRNQEHRGRNGGGVIDRPGRACIKPGENQNSGSHTEEHRSQAEGRDITHNLSASITCQAFSK